MDGHDGEKRELDAGEQAEETGKGTTDNGEGGVVRPDRPPPKRRKRNRREHVGHDEAFKKLLETFFKEFMELFFPDVDQMLDYSQTRFLMQELLVDIVGGQSRTLDLLLETKYKALDAFILIHYEPLSYKEDDFHERMFIYYSRLFERHRDRHRIIIPIAIFTGDDVKEEKDTLHIFIPGHDILRFRFLKVELRNQNWRRFADSDNPVAAALLAKMGYNERKERRELRLAYLRMLLRLRSRLDDARMALVMSVADLYYKPTIEEDQILLEQLRDQYVKEAEMMELMPAWKRWGIEEGMEKGKEEGRAEVIRKFLDKGFSPEVVAETVGAPVEDIRKLMERQ